MQEIGVILICVFIYNSVFFPDRISNWTKSD
jgi:hypothetical protein